MDINSLLSPQEASSNRSQNPHPLTTSISRASRSNGNVTSPSMSNRASAPSLAYNGFTYPKASTSSPTLASLSSTLRSHVSNTPPVDAGRLNRQSSTTGMDTLADLASMQHHQRTARDSDGKLRSTGLHGDSSPSLNTGPSAHAQSLSPSSGTGIKISEMSEPKMETYVPSIYATNALSEGELQVVAELDEYLRSNPHAFDSHVRLVKLLHKGLISHLQSGISAPSTPHAYDLLPHLKRARETMSARFAVGEELWIEWIEDEKVLTRSIDGILGIIEMCQKAVEQEQGSSRLWLLYSDWMLTVYRIANPHDPVLRNLNIPSSTTPELSGEDLLVAQATITWQQVLDIWLQGVQATMWRINDSNLLWDRCTEMILQQCAPGPGTVSFEQLKSHYLERLVVPHATWDQTFQSFSTFISSYDNVNYEDTMIHGTQLGSAAKQKYEMRDPWEMDLAQAQRQGDRDAEWKIFTNYIDWEINQSRKKNLFDFDLAYALHQRAVLRFPTDTELWESLVMLLNDEFSSNLKQKSSILSVLDRATQHCPWSGSLWSQYLVAAERESQPFSVMEQIKHKATSTGTLDAGGLEEVIKVHITWGGVLRRRAFGQGATEEDLDVAEVGIRSAIEDMENLGRSTYGRDYQGDPAHRLERIYIRYLTQRHNWSAARETWRSLVPRLGDTHEFWLRYYLWEMGTYSKLTYQEGQPDIRMPKPIEATKVLRQALKRPKLDWPEKILEIFKIHCEDFEDAQELQLASVLIWKTMRAVKKRRVVEQNEAYGVTQQPYVAQQEHSANRAEGVATTKRKREEAETLNETPVKKSKPDLHQSVEVEMTEQPQAATLVPKRDRENATVVVKNLPPQIQEVKLRQYFRDCGTINNLKISSEDNGESCAAIIEFESKEDVLAASTKDMKELEGRPITVRVTGQTTLFVTNFPPSADELYIRELFSKYGKIVEVRFPSLKYDTHRRFCYIQFSSSDEADAATAEDGRKVDEKHILIAKISDPARKKARTGALYDGREIFMSNLEWSATESDLRRLFGDYGAIEKVRIPVKVNGQSKGIAFVEFAKKEDAEAALAQNGTVFKGRPLKVEIATDNQVKRQATKIIQQAAQSLHSPASTPHLEREGSFASVALHASPAATAASEISSRTIALLGVPDTINDTRIRALAESYGSLVKVVLRPDHQGAIVEFAETTSAGKAAMGLDGDEIAPGRRISTGTVPELLRQKAEYKNDKLSAKVTKRPTVGAIVPSAMPIRRPVQPGARRGGRGGLGLKNSGVGLSGPRAAAADPPQGPNVGNDAADEDEKARVSPQKPKSNADFKALLCK